MERRGRAAHAGSCSQHRSGGEPGPSAVLLVEDRSPGGAHSRLYGANKDRVLFLTPLRGTAHACVSREQQSFQKGAHRRPLASQLGCLPKGCGSDALTLPRTVRCELSTRRGGSVPTSSVASRVAVSSCPASPGSQLPPGSPQWLLLCRELRKSRSTASSQRSSSPAPTFTSASSSAPCEAPMVTVYRPGGAYTSR